MKKLLNAAVVSVLCFGMAMPVLADGTPDSSTSAAGGSISVAGMTATQLGPAVTRLAGPIASQQIAKSSPLVTVFVNAKSYFTLDEAALTTSNAGKFAYLTWTFHNQNDFSFQMNDYFMRLTNNSGTPFSVKMLPQDKDINKVPAQGTVQLHYYAKVNPSTVWSDLIVKLIKWDFGAAQFDQTLWKFKIPANYSMVTPVHYSRQMNSNGGSLQAGVAQFVMNPADDPVEAYITLTMLNVGNQSLPLPGYSYSIETQDGRSFPLQLANAADVHLTPLMSNELQLAGPLPSAAKLAGASLLLSQTDDALHLRVAVAAFALPHPTDGAPAADYGSSRTIALPASGTSIAAAIKQASLNEQADAYYPSIIVTMENIGHKNAAVPNYTYAILTSEGNVYPLTSAAAHDLVIASGKRKELKFNTVIPASLSQDGWKLIVTQEDTVNHLSLPIAAFVLPSTYDGTGSVGSKLAFTDQIGSFSAQWSALQRLPWNDQDIISSEITLKNEGSNSAAIPLLKGYYLLDNSIKVDAFIYPIDKAIALPAQSALHYIFYAKIPFTASFSQLTLVLEEQDDTQTIQTLAEFNGSQDLLNTPKLALGDPYKISQIGRMSELNWTQIHIYPGKDDDLLYAEMDHKNLEKRVVSTANWAGYLETADGMYIPVSFTSPSATINPSSDSIIALWGSIPKGTVISSLSLIIGEAVTGTGTSSGAPASGASSSGNTSPGNPSAATDAFVRAVEMPLPAEASSLQSFYQLHISPYTLAIRNITTVVAAGNQGFTFSFDYSLSKALNSTHDPIIPSGMKHQLIIQMTDSQGQIYEQKIDTESPGGLDLSGGTYSFAKHDSDSQFLSKTQQSHQYNLQIFDEFLGYRLLITSQPFLWFN